MAECMAWPACTWWNASILPDCPRANTNAVTMMLGERIGDEPR
jgi:hypothetical protein